MEKKGTNGAWIKISDWKREAILISFIKEIGRRKKIIGIGWVHKLTKNILLVKIGWRKIKRNRRNKTELKDVIRGRRKRKIKKSKQIIWISPMIIQWI